MKVKQYARPAIRTTLALLAVGVAEPAAAQWSTVSDQFYLPAEHNWEFRRRYIAADRLFNAFDYGHAKLYEELWTRPNGAPSRLESDVYAFLTERLLVRPPRIPLEEGAIEVAYAKLAPEAKQMFDWAHLLHRQTYDVWADESIPLAEKDARVAELLAYYRTRPDIAFSSVPKSMDIMDGQFFSSEFREKYPKFNGLIWAYHWLQVGLYEPLMQGRDVQERQAGVTATVTRFRQMLTNPPRTMPHLMPMTSAVAPTFARRYPEVGAVFDNLHMLHDVISDILVSAEVPREAKRREILRQAELFRSDTAYAISREEWFAMGEMMGVNNMGGVASGLLTALPEPTVAYGASMAGMSHGNMAGMQGQQQGGMAGMQHGNMNMPAQGQQQGNMQGMQHGNMNMPGQGQQQGNMQGMDHSRMGGMQQGQQGQAQGGMSGMQHGNMPGMQQGQMPGMQHGGSNMGGMGSAASQELGGTSIQQGQARGQMQGMQHGGMNMGGTSMQQMMQMHQRMMSDPVIRERMASDPVLQRMMQQMNMGMMGGASPAGMQGQEGGMAGMQHGNMQQGNMQGMQHGNMNMPAQGQQQGNMQGMDHSRMGGMQQGQQGGMPMQQMPMGNMSAAAAEDRRQAVEFIVRLLSDPQVAARVHADPELHQLWSDPEVQRRLAEMRRTTPAAARPAPAPQPAPSHNHR